jgi:hypothetical protein
MKRFLSWSWHTFIQALLKTGVKDAQCGFKVFDKDLIKMILRKVTVTNRTFEVVMLYHVKESGVKIKEVPVSYVHDFDTRMPLGKAIPVMFFTLIGVVLVNNFRGSHLLPMNFLRRLNIRLRSV